MSKSTSNQALGFSGKVTSAFLGNAITPLLALLGLLLGLFAIIITPKEEEPQIDVTFADVFVPFPGATPAEVEQLVTLPAEQVISQIRDIDTLYSFSRADGAMFIVAFDVGVPRSEAIVRLYNQLYANMDKLPRLAGVGEPLIKPRGIDDVPIVNLTLWSEDPKVGAPDLTRVAQNLETELKRIPGTREVYTVGQHQLVLNVRIDPAKLMGYDLSLDQIDASLKDNNLISMPAALVQDNQVIKVQAGQFLQSVDDVKNLLVAVNKNRNGRNEPVFLGDIADITLVADIADANAFYTSDKGSFPAVTIAIGKQAGMNAVEIAQKVRERVIALENILLPDNLNVQITRDYGQTAADKSNTLIFKLIFATAAVVLLVLLTMGLRESLVVGIAIIITLAVTLFASWAWGFTLNRVSLFALIFSIGILVDDAIVVVENIHRHMSLTHKPMAHLIPAAVDEVGGPTILATFTVIAALLPMAFVSGLMGPYMSPIPINASMGMLISLAVAFTITPWLAEKLLKRHQSPNSSAPIDAATPAAHTQPQIKATSEARTDIYSEKKGEANSAQDKLHLLFTRLMTPFLNGRQGRKARTLLGAAVVGLIAIALALPITQHVVLKMLPFDNKSEFQVLLDMPEGTPVEDTQRVLQEMSDYLLTVDEVKDLQLYAGTAAPMNFNGLVRHYFLRQSPELGDIQVNLRHKSERQRDSHAIALAVRPELARIGERYQGDVKVVEVPPGPPVWSPIVAEVYGPSPDIRQQAAQEVKTRFQATKDVVDIDIMVPANQARWQVIIDRQRAALLGVPYSNIVDAISTAIGGKDTASLHLNGQKTPVPIRLELAEASKLDLDELLNLSLQGSDGKVAIAELVSINKGHIEREIVHKNMVPMIMVTADMAGPLDSPLYGMFDIAGALTDSFPAMAQHYIEQPSGLSQIAILWDGEWKITYETFRDMGIAYGVGMIAIYLLVVAHFRSYLVPLIIMAPIPLTIIGVMPGHALLGAQFTATSMIGMIALAGIIVRNSILLVDFIKLQQKLGTPLEQAVITAASVRAKPIVLTAIAAMIGALFILDDPIFNGLAISLIFGILVSTALTLVVIPLLYYAWQYPRQG